MAGWVAAATIGSSLIGGVLSGNAAQDAANTQAQAGAAAQQQLLGIGKNVSGMYTPYQQTGQLGLNNLNQMANSGYLSNQFNAIGSGRDFTNFTNTHSSPSLNYNSPLRNYYS